MAATRSYVDIGAAQRKEDGTHTPTTSTRSYVDIGAAQRQETGGGGSAEFTKQLALLGVG